MNKNKKREQKVITSRGKILVLFCILLFIVILSRLVYLQLVNKEKYEVLKNNNVTKTNYITPERGDIYDRNGVLIAGSRGLFSLTIIPEKIEGFRKNKKIATENFIKDLSDLIELSDYEKSDIKEKLRKSPLFVEVVLKSDVNIDELTSITSNRKYLNSISVTSIKVRDYKKGEEYLNVLGYVGKVSANDLSNSTIRLTNLDYVGKNGIEKDYNNLLMGEHGEEVIGVNAYGKSIIREKIKEAKKGSDISLTIDSDLQSLAYKLLGKEKGAIVALDPNNGDVLAIASTPTYDPNKLIKGITEKEYREIFENSEKSPFFNRAVSGQYPPASTIKPFIAIAGLLGEWIDPDKNYWCGPYYKIKGSSRRFNDWKNTGHGWINLKQSIEMSADVYYYKLGQSMGIDYIHDTISYFNFGKKTNIDLYPEKEGLLPSTEWKRKNKKESWYTGETLIASIGQGFMMSTPIQLAQATSILVNGGTSYKPKLLKNKESVIQSKIDIPENYTKIVKDGMRDVLFGSSGTARQWKRNLIRYDQGGKTGTSQVYSTKGERPDKDIELPKDLRDHALYIGFAPFNNPKIVVAVVIENIGGGSTYAAPVGIEMMQKYLDKYYPNELLEGKEILESLND